MRGEIVTSMIIEDAQLDDICAVKVIAKNPAGEDKASATLKVQGKWLVL